MLNSQKLWAQGQDQLDQDTPAFQNSKELNVYITSSKAESAMTVYITQLESQLNEERKARVQLEKEMKELRQMMQKLTSSQNKDLI